MINDMMTIEMVNKEFGFSSSTLAKARMNSELFPYYKLARKIMYKRSEIIEEFEKNRVGIHKGEENE